MGIFTIEKTDVCAKLLLPASILLSISRRSKEEEEERERTFFVTYSGPRLFLDRLIDYPLYEVE